MTTVPIRRALVSVSDKSGLKDLAFTLHEAGVEIVSTGSTATVIDQTGVPVTPVEQVTGFPECLDGRVKTLHPAVHAGILADRGDPAHRSTLEELDIAAVDLVVVNLYPFTEAVADGAEPEACLAHIDIGGPAMLRAAAKNHPSVAVICDPAHYEDVAAAVAGDGFSLAQRQQLAAAAFRHTATYDVHIASWIQDALAPDDEGSGFPRWVGATWDRATVLRYGENPHQRAALYTEGADAAGLASATQLHGKAMSYNNYVDADAAWRAAHDQGRTPTVAIIKHANPCGIATGADIAEAYAKAHDCDPLSAFGAVVAANEVVTEAMAAKLAEVFTEVLCAPGFTEAALRLLTGKKNLRLLQLMAAPHGNSNRQISGGLLIQSPDRIDAEGDDERTWRLVAGQPVDEATMADLSFAWRAVRAVKSNAILLASNGAAVGIGMGQVNRVDACRLAVERANTLGRAQQPSPPRRARGAVAASDAFFPFPDGLEVLLEAGVRAVVQPGGSIRDEDVVAAAEAAGVALYLTGTRHFAH